MNRDRQELERHKTSQKAKLMWKPILNYFTLKMVDILLALDFRQRRMVVIIYASVGTANGGQR